MSKKKTYTTTSLHKLLSVVLLLDFSANHGLSITSNMFKHKYLGVHKRGERETVRRTSWKSDVVKRELSVNSG